MPRTPFNQLPEHKKQRRYERNRAWRRANPKRHREINRESDRRIRRQQREQLASDVLNALERQESRADKIEVLLACAKLDLPDDFEERYGGDIER